MSLRINDTTPNFKAQTTQGPIDFHRWIGDSWAILFSHPKDFTPVCTTELGYMAKIEPEFTRRGAKLIGLSVDPVDSHKRWLGDIEETQGAKVNYPIIGDGDLGVSKLYNMLPAEEPGSSEGRTAATNQTVRSVFVIGPDKKIKLMLTYPMTTGRNFDEILRVLDSMQLTARHKVATPVNWKQGDDVIIAGSVSDDDAKKLFPQGWKSPKPYLRIVEQPKDSVRYQKNGIATFDAPVEDVFQYMSKGDHPHAAFKQHKLAGIAGNVVTIDAEVYNPDGSTFRTMITHKLNRPNSIETTMKGGAFDGARFCHSYTPAGQRTRVDLSGEFPAMTGMSEADELKMIEGFFSVTFAEDEATIRSMVR
jgi:alkyl hydroperoxide reductase subunit AhpC